MSLWDKLRRQRNSLSAQILLLLTLALLPLGLIAVYQTASVIEEANDLATKDVLARTSEAATDEYALIRRALGAAQALGQAARRVDAETCTEVAQGLVASEMFFEFAGFIDRSGQMACSSTGEAVDFSGTDDWVSFSADPRLMLTVNSSGEATGQSVLIVTVPIRDAAGELLGGASVSIPHRLTDERLRDDSIEADIALVTFGGKILSASTGINDADPFRVLDIQPRSLDIPEAGLTLERVDADGNPITVAIVGLAEAQIYVVGIWRTVASETVSIVGTAAPAFPVIMWLASLFVAFLAIERLVLRHLTELRRKMVSFSVDAPEGGMIKLDDAPREVQEIALSYNRLVERIASNTAELEQSIGEKEVLLKEVHHRVKNNLQLIASILNMQLRTISNPATVSVLRRVQDRVMSLATVHKALYTDTRVDTVRADDLLREIINSVLNVALPSGTSVTTTLSLEPVSLDPDEAVPLSLLVTEAVTNAMKYVSADHGDQPVLQVSLSEDPDGRVRVEVQNSIGNTPTGNEGANESTGLGSRLIEAFVSQLDGQLHIDETDTAYVLRVDFVKLAARSATKAAAE